LSLLNTVYVWGQLQYLARDMTEQDRFFRVCQNANIKRAECQFNYYTPFVTGVEQPLVKALISRAHSVGIEFYAIPDVSAADLNTPTNTKPQIITILDYNKNNPSAKFDGFSFDVESPGQGLVVIANYTAWIRQVKAFTNSLGDTLLTQGMKTSAYIDAPKWLSGGSASALSAVPTLYREFNAVNLVGYETTLNTAPGSDGMIAHLADGPSTCQANGVEFRCGYELDATQTFYGAIGHLGKTYYEQLAASVDAYFASYSCYGGRYIEQYSSLSPFYDTIGGITVNINGTVKNARTGANVAGKLVTISIAGAATAVLTATTDVNGAFTQTYSAAPGTYSIQATTPTDTNLQAGSSPVVSFTAGKDAVTITLVVS
jgi:hypothetical protein